MSLAINKKRINIFMVAAFTSVISFGVIAATANVFNIGGSSVHAADPTPTDEVYFTFDSATGTINDYDEINGPSDVVIPETIGGVAVTAIARSTWSDGVYVGSFANKGLTSVVIPNSVTLIDGNAFTGNPLESVVIGTVDHTGPASLEIMPNFNSMPTLTSVTLGNNVSSIHSSFDNTSIVDLFIPNSVEYLGGSLSRSPELRTVQVGTSDYEGEAVLDLCDGMLSGIPKLEELRVGNTVKSIGCGFGGGNPLLHTIELGNGVKTVGGGAFAGLSSLKSLDLGNSVETLWQGIFSNTIIEDLTIPNSVKTISGSAFTGSSELKTITFGTEDYNGTPTIDLNSSSFGSVPALETVVVNGGVSVIGSDFGNTPLLKNLTIKGSVQTISSSAFGNSQITEVSFPSSVEFVGSGAFRNGHITKITVAGDTEIASGAFIDNTLNTGEYIRLYTTDPANPHGYTDDYRIQTIDTDGNGSLDVHFAYIVNPATLQIDYVNENGDTLAPSWFGVGDTLTDYTVAANPDGDFTQYYRYGDVKTISTPSFAGYIAPPVQTLALTQGTNIAPMIYEVPAAASVPEAPNTGLQRQGNSSFNAIIVSIVGLLAFLLFVVSYMRKKRT